METDLIYQLALSTIKGLSPSYAKKLIDHFGSASAIFHAPSREIAAISEMGEKKAAAIARFTEFPSLEKEIKFLEKYAIHPLFITDKAYPQRLLDNDDAPVLLFYKGNADLNAARVVSIIGTRSPTEYGKTTTEQLVKELSATGALIVSGLAYGIDTAAHKAALKHDLQTVGILAHGLDRIYPPENTPLAKDMLKHGGLLTCFCSGNDPETYHFPIRNRIVAGICDALIVTETRQKGGSMLTIHNALSLKKKIFAVPGRMSDTRSTGCNALIQKNKATLLMSAKTLLEEMQWDHPSGKPIEKQPFGQSSLFPATADMTGLSDDEKRIFTLLKEKKKQYIDDIASATGLNFGKLALPLLSLEWKNLIISQPGKLYCILE